MTTLTIPIEQSDLNALSDLASSMGNSVEQLVSAAICELVGKQQYEPFASEAEALEFADEMFAEVMADESW